MYCPHEKTELGAAKEFLREKLKDGPVWAKRLYSDARDAGIFREDASAGEGRTSRQV
jgi:hypothetical protein